MNAWIALPTAAAVAAGTALIVVQVARPSAGASESTEVAAPAAPSALDERLDALAAESRRLENEMASLRAALDARAPVQSVIDEAALEAAVARALAAHGAKPELHGAVAAAPARPFANAKEAFAQLLAIGDYDDAQELWSAIREAGLLDEVVAEYEARAAASPDDPELRLELGQAYLQKIFAAGQGPEAGKWAMKADKAFDDALALDERHWEARFYKASSLSFWPPLFGKQAEAIRHFEILAAQQQGVAQQPQFAQTHLLLGNLYQQTGQMEKAQAAWVQGLANFPGDPQFKQKLELAGGH